MGIVGVGIDVVEVSRIARLDREWGDDFLTRVYTEKELHYCLGKKRKNEHLAGRFAAKEAVIKALGKKIPWRSIEIGVKENGRPFASLVCQGEKMSKVNSNLQISITHECKYALAFAILDSKDSGSG